MGLFDKISALETERKINKKLDDFFDNEDYLKRLALRYAHDSIDNNKIKSIFKSEILKEGLENYSFNKRYLELIQMDVDSLYELNLKGHDTAKFTSQQDLNEYFGKEYSLNFQNRYSELVENSSNDIPLRKLKPLPSYIKKEKEEIIKFGPKFKQNSNKSSESSEKLGKLLYGDENVERDEYKTDKNEFNLTKSKFDIEIYTNVKSNTALASTALFLISGVFIAESKEEMKYIKTQLQFSGDGIKIYYPSSFHKYSDFRYFKVENENEYYLFYLGFKDESIIHFKSKEKYLVDVIMNKIESSDLSYEIV